MKVNLSIKEVKLKEPGTAIAKIRQIKSGGIAEAWALQDFVSEHVADVEYPPGTTQTFDNYQKHGLGLGCYADDMLIAYIFTVYGGEERYAVLAGYSERGVAAASIDICEVVVHPDYWGNGLRMLLISVVEDIARQVGIKKVFIKCINEKRSLHKLIEMGYEIKATIGDGKLHVMEKAIQQP